MLVGHVIQAAYANVMPATILITRSHTPSLRHARSVHSVSWIGEGAPMIGSVKSLTNQTRDLARPTSARAERIGLGSGMTATAVACRRSAGITRRASMLPLVENL